MKTGIALLALTLSSCASLSEERRPLEWSSLGTGCYDRGLSEVLFWPDRSLEIGLTDIRIGRLPDTGQGPGMLAHFRRRLDGPFGQSTAPPELFLAVGDWKRTCAVLIQHSACPAAQEVYAHLASQSIPIGFAFDDPTAFTVMHGTIHALSVTDGQGNQTDWSFVGLDHPLQDAVARSLDKLESCAAPAMVAFQQLAEK
ncbi:hypothetical protein [Lysobacter silvisoli]|uniref:Lipoprotein n=1 Tax=Lysobacter silvisoli TaxID=2293254 RepID=A0A371JWK5_9GAMM|nr:hypothetical protein [Lysobacter silvisoli]RDZ26020.1 hypothetical protein DX914_19360 [Lysobacter silvisoli]